MNSGTNPMMPYTRRPTYQDYMSEHDYWFNYTRTSDLSSPTSLPEFESFHGASLSNAHSIDEIKESAEARGYGFPTEGDEGDEHPGHTGHPQLSTIGSSDLAEFNSWPQAQGSRDAGHRKDAKQIRNSRACTICQTSRTKCQPTSDIFGPCMRCSATGQECKFKESQRGKNPSRRIAVLQKQVEHMEDMSRLLGESLDNQSSSRYRPLPPHLSYW